MTRWDEIATAISAATGEAFKPDSQRSVGGGCINTTAVVSAGKRRYFVKLNRANRLGMFEAESAALAALAATKTLRIPAPIASGIAGDEAFLAIEYLDLGGRGDLAQAGAQLAELHRSQTTSFGFDCDNTIGATPQPNGWMDDWIGFLRERRLGFQLKLAERKGHGGELRGLGERLLAKLDGFFADGTPAPSLLHGDLWGGNFAFDRDGSPCIYDPASYYGDREADLAMTELFGGFGPRFRAGYTEAWPLAPGHERRKTLYNLYHILNHLNLFGPGYLGQAVAMLRSLT
ncbi:MAG: fructosamine kinase family protein [Chromatiales bacterium]|nr:fructosamine kinase family protein [Chromatiales bacterium]